MPIIRAIGKRDRDIITCLLEAGADLGKTIPKFKIRPIHYCLMRDAPEIFDMFLEQGDRIDNITVND
jgi:ankyrin repeat protein